MASEFYLVLPSNSSMITHPNNTLAQYITNLPRRINISGVVDLRRGFESLYVYSSIVEPRIVGDKIAPLLRIVPITGRHGEMVTTRFDHVQYIPVLSREFGSVETEIRDDTGRPVPFERGKVTVTLHFRRCSSGLFR